jgi:mRNA-degrading endonuclease RelE of RelBE toxin-antitoxin system
MIDVGHLSQQAVVIYDVDWVRNTIYLCSMSHTRET